MCYAGKKMGMGEALDEGQPSPSYPETKQKRGFQLALGSSTRILRGERGPGGLDSWWSSSQMGQGFLGPRGGMRPWRAAVIGCR